MEALCKIYLELANVVPPNCISSREKAMQKDIDGYGIALMMIANGCADAPRVAADALAKISERRT